MLGDININRLLWDVGTENECKLTEELHTIILPLGVSQMLTMPSRVGTKWLGQQEESGLDHLYSSRPNKLRSIESS